MQLSTYRNGTPAYALLDRMVDDLARPLASTGSAFAYDLVQLGEDGYRLEMPVPGLTEAELDIETRAGALVVRGRPAARAEDEKVLHAGVARRPFERRFTLGEHIKVASARLADGMLALELVREVPEALKPRTIAIRRDT